MRQLKAFLKAKKWICSKECACLTINMWRCADLQNGEEFCGCWDATMWDIHSYATKWFSTSEILDNVADADAVIEDANTIINWAWEELRPFYNAVKEWKTLEAWAEKEWLTLDDSWTCDDELVDNNAAFTLYVSAMWAIDCKYLWLDNDELINATIISDYLDEIAND